MSTKELQNTTTLITGAGRGIGRSIAHLFAKAGSTVYLTARTAHELESVVQEIKKKEGMAHSIVADLTKEENIKKTADLMITKNIDILINNAGRGFNGSFHKISIDDMDTTLEVNLRAPMLLTKFLLPHFLKKNLGTIINIASIAGKTGFADSVTYCVSKHGMMGFTHALFEEVREKNIKVSAICPGFVDTSLIPQTRKIDRSKMIRPEDVAKTALYVATSSKESCPIEIILRPQNNPRV